MFRRADQLDQREIGTGTFSVDLGSTEVVKVARLSWSALAGCGRTNPRGEEKTVFGTRDRVHAVLQPRGVGNTGERPFRCVTGVKAVPRPLIS